jgi:hypothetical protein
LLIIFFFFFSVDSEFALTEGNEKDADIIISGRNNEDLLDGFSVDDIFDNPVAATMVNVDNLRFSKSINGINAVDGTVDYEKERVKKEKDDDFDDFQPFSDSGSFYDGDSPDNNNSTKIFRLNYEAPRVQSTTVNIVLT